MATAPWRCSQCGTINEPVANSCRTCGKWPSLFDLQDSVVEETEAHGFPETEFAPTAVEPEPFQPMTFEPETYRTDTYEQPAPVEAPGEVYGEPAEPEPDEAGRPRWVNWIVPLAVLVYFAISFFFNER